MVATVATATVMATSTHKASADGPDRLTVMMLAVAAFLVVLALLASQFQASAAPVKPRVIVMRRVYQTRVIETISGPGRGGPPVSQSVSSSGAPSTSVAVAPVTRTS